MSGQQKTRGALLIEEMRDIGSASFDQRNPEAAAQARALRMHLLADPRFVEYSLEYIQSMPFSEHDRTKLANQTMVAHLEARANAKPDAALESQTNALYTRFNNESDANAGYTPLKPLTDEQQQAFTNFQSGATPAAKTEQTSQAATVAQAPAAPVRASAAPAETAPVDAAPVEAAPVEAAPVEATPVETPAVAAAEPAPAATPQPVTVSPEPAPLPAASAPAQDIAEAAQPGPVEYSVRKGDNLSKIAHEQYGLTNQHDVHMKALEIARHNGLANPNRISIGQTLKLPGLEPAVEAKPQTDAIIVNTDSLKGNAIFNGTTAGGKPLGTVLGGEWSRAAAAPDSTPFAGLQPLGNQDLANSIATIRNESSSSGPLGEAWKLGGTHVPDYLREPQTIPAPSVTLPQPNGFSPLAP